MKLTSVPGSDLSQVFHAAQLSTPLSDAETVELDDSPADAFVRLKGLRFDQAPVTSNGHFVGWVLTAPLETASKVKAVLRPLAQCAILSVGAPLKDLLARLGSNGLVFLAGHQGLEAFVTPSDLDRQAARGHFYLLLSGIEMLLSDIVNEVVPEQDVEAAIAGYRLEDWMAARSKNWDTRPVEYLDLEPLCKLFSSVANGRGWNDHHDHMLDELCQLRPSVMHATRPLLAARSPQQLAHLADSAAQVTRSLTEYAHRLRTVGTAARLGDSL
jgi:hypothetical protein